ncbi:MAG: hypothetical protein NT015_14570 [Alphaproteobacteria bacterium]|nr:hypothetical protein [Alphaproteobacteria bacterium]
MGRGQLSQRLQVAGFVLALFALTFKSVLPPGFMLAAAHERPIAVVLCTSHGAVEVELPGGKSNEAPSDQPQSDMGPCVCAAAAEFSAPIVSAELEAPCAHHLVVARVLILADGASARLAAPPPWPTGPPISI